MDRRPLEANAALINMTGYTPEEFFQLSGFELSYPEDADIGVPELQEVIAGKLDSYLKKAGFWPRRFLKLPLLKRHWPPAHKQFR